MTAIYPRTGAATERAPRPRPSDPALVDLLDKIAAGEPLDLQDGRACFATKDLTGLGAIANWAAQARHGDVVYFNINRHVNPSNICAIKCKLCAFGTTARDPSSYAHSVDEVVERARHHPPGATEIHMVGGLHPDFNIEYYERLFEALRTQLPHLHIQALTMVELDYVAGISNLSLRETILRLKEAGLGSIPGGGAEIFDRAVRDQICRPKISGERWLEVAEEVHRCGLKSNCTMLFGHVETIDHRLDHLDRLRRLQERTSGFQCLIPLPFLPENTYLDHLPGPDGVDILKTYAVSRLMLHNIPHLKAFWIMVGLRLAQTSLHYGVNDLDGTVVEEHIMHDAGSTAPQGLTLEQLLHLIRAAGKSPVQRDTVYNVVRTYG